MAPELVVVPAGGGGPSGVMAEDAMHRLQSGILPSGVRGTAEAMPKQSLGGLSPPCLRVRPDLLFQPSERLTAPNGAARAPLRMSRIQPVQKSSPVTHQQFTSLSGLSLDNFRCSANNKFMNSATAIYVRVSTNGQKTDS